MALINTTIKNDIYNTPLPNIFIDRYMPEANATFSCIYIYTLRHCYKGGLALSTKETAEAFNILESDVIKAWDYWAEKELVKMHKDSDGSLSIEFLPMPLENIRKTSDFPAEPADIQIGEKPPKYSPKELEIYKNSYEEVKELFESAEKYMGKLLSSNDLSTIYSFYDWLRLPFDVIKYLVQYCTENGHRRVKYMEAVAIDWAENGINTLDKAKAHVHLFNKDYREILKAIGQGSRNPAPAEITYMDKWIKEYQMPINLILEACDKTILTTGKAQFGYIDKIIEGWHNAGAKTIDDIKALDAQFKKTSEKTGDKLKIREKSKSKFANHEAHERNFDEIEKLKWQHLQNSLKGK